MIKTTAPDVNKKLDLAGFHANFEMLLALNNSNFAAARNAVVAAAEHEFMRLSQDIRGGVKPFCHVPTDLNSLGEEHIDDACLYINMLRCTIMRLLLETVRCRWQTVVALGPFLRPWGWGEYSGRLQEVAER